MRIFVPVALAGIGVLASCGMISGPSDSVIEDLARQQMAANAPGTENAAAVKQAKISKRGLCNTQAEPGTYVCMVDVTAKMPGQEQEGTQTFVVKVKKSADGKWIAAD